jgi:hypothetical protein
MKCFPPFQASVENFGFRVALLKFIIYLCSPAENAVNCKKNDKLEYENANYSTACSERKNRQNVEE